jgi:hypothetical protein
MWEPALTTCACVKFAIAVECAEINIFVFTPQNVELQHQNNSFAVFSLGLCHMLSF